MSSIESQIQQLDRNISESRKLIEMGDALQRLKSNRDFKKVVMEGFFEKEAIRLVHLKADSNMQSAEAQKSIIAQMDAIGALNQYFTTIGQIASLARKSLAYDEEAREELASGEAE